MSDTFYNLAGEFIYGEILEQPGIVRRIAATDRAWPEAPGRTLVTGAGDCLAAAELSRALHPDRALEALPVLEASTLAPGLGADDLLLALSVSGRTPRVIEAAGRARAAGARVVAVTDDPTAPLASHAHEVWPIGASPVESLSESSYATSDARQYVGYHHDVAQTKTFLATLLTLARAAGTLEDAAWERLAGTVAALCEPHFHGRIRTAATQWARAGQAFVLGTGTALPLARFGAYKLLECNRTAQFSDPEEYCHTHYFVTRPRDAVVFLLADPEARRRASEIAPVLRELFDAHLIVLRSDDVAPLHAAFDVSVASGESDLERYVALTVGLEWITYLWGRVDAPDINRFHAGHDTERLVGASLRTIRRSEIRIPPA